MSQAPATGVVPTDLPGHELVSGGLADLAAGRESEAALIVAMAAPRLRALGYDVPPCPSSWCERPSHRLYELLAAALQTGDIVGESDEEMGVQCGGGSAERLNGDVMPRAGLEPAPPD